MYSFNRNQIKIKAKIYAKSPNLSHYQRHFDHFGGSKQIEKLHAKSKELF
jgi:hypothetical protein